MTAIGSALTRSGGMLVLLSCARVSGMNSARLLEPGESEMVVALPLDAGGDSLSRASGLALPRPALGYRTGLREGLDMGVRVFPVGVQLDLRLGIMTEGPWHMAINPGLSGAALMHPNVGWTEIGLHLPLVVERQVGARWTLGAGVEATTSIRGAWMAVDGLDPGTGARLDEYLGGGVRVARHGERLRFGWHFMGAVNVLRAGPMIWSTGPEIGWNTMSEGTDRE